MNGYAAALLNNPDREMPLECVTMAELKAMLAYRRHQDSMKAEKAAEQAKKKRRKNVLQSNFATKRKKSP